jgi:DNA-binding CsgD family transcriptional regulator
MISVPWLLVEAMPVTSFGSDVFGDGRAILLLTDLTVPLVTDQTLLAVVFGLTAAEAKMASRIAQGNNIDEAARAVGVSRETARTQLKAVFQKTSTKRQAELVAVLGRLRPVRARSSARFSLIGARNKASPSVGTCPFGHLADRSREMTPSASKVERSEDLPATVERLSKGVQRSRQVRGP